MKEEINNQDTKIKLFHSVVTEIDHLSLPIKITQFDATLSQFHRHNLLIFFHDAPDGHFPNSFLVFHSNPATYVALPKFRMHFSSSVSQPTAHLFITSYQQQFPSRPDTF